MLFFYFRKWKIRFRERAMSPLTQSIQIASKTCCKELKVAPIKIIIKTRRNNIYLLYPSQIKIFHTRT